MADQTGQDKKAVLRTKLNEQRHLLQKSIKDFAAGDLAEGLRIATTIRVLVHETGRNKPLLKQLTANFLELPIIDRPKQPNRTNPPGVQEVTIMRIPVRFKLSSSGTSFDPTLEGEYEVTILGKWWEGPSWVILPGLGGFTRKEIVLSVADKDGGTHVDMDRNQRLKRLFANESFQIGAGKASPLDLCRYLTASAGVQLMECLDRNFPVAK